MKISIVLCAIAVVLCVLVAPSVSALSGPDLVITAIDGPASVNAGGSVTITTTLMNRGDAKAGYSYVKIYLSSDSVVAASDIYLGQRYISSLPAASSSTGKNSVRIPSNLAGGSYYIGAIADATGLVSEANEGNNIGIDANPMSIIPLPASDMVISSITAPGSATPGSAITINCTVLNLGNARTGSTYVYLYLSQDAVITKSDLNLGKWYISSLAPGISASSRTTVTIPMETVNGAYYLGAIADPQNFVVESNEANNTRSAEITIGTSTPPPTPPQTTADLIVSSVTAPSNVAAGSQIEINCTVSNKGNASAASAYAYLYLSTDTGITTSDTYLGSWSFSALAPGASVIGKSTVTIPAGTSAGAYYVGAVADGTNKVTESNEGNNVRASSSPLVIVAPTPPQTTADLIVSSVTAPSNVAAGSSIELNCTVSNRGNASAASAYAYFYLSTDTGITTADTYLGSWSFSALAPGASVTGKSTVTIPAGTSAGTYYIGAIADGTNKVAESNEGNNAHASSSPLVIAAPPPPPTGSTVQEKIAYYTNQERINAGKTALVYDTALAVVAQDHSSDMAINHFFDHTSPTNGTFAARLASHHYTFSYAGENIAMHSAHGPSSNPDTVARAFVQMWMGSSGHKANILNANYNRIGVGVAYGQECYATQDFARK